MAGAGGKSFKKVLKSPGSLKEKFPDHYYNHQVSQGRNFSESKEINSNDPSLTCLPASPLNHNCGEILAGPSLIPNQQKKIALTVHNLGQNPDEHAESIYSVLTTVLL